MQQPIVMLIACVMGISVKEALEKAKAHHAAGRQERIRQACKAGVKNLFRCGHPKTADNSKPDGNGYTRCRECRIFSNLTYERSGKGRARRARYRASAAGMAAYERRVKSGRTAKASREARARKKAYLEEVFRDTPDKRHRIF